VDDLRAVLDEAGAERPAIFATGDCGFIALPFAATYPDRVGALILHQAAPTWRKSDEIPWGATDDELEANTKSSRAVDGRWSRKANPSLTSGADGLAWCIRYERVSLARGGCHADGWGFDRTDVRGVLPSIQVPALLLYRREDAEEL
jgi:pimeloyl-ACP methyl ester carboxylesterase